MSGKGLPMMGSREDSGGVREVWRRACVEERRAR
ncbi:hypothetical protein ERO13_A06G173602v2 [Gossypium hirsutum]|nr:hypothetical protein ERO13_A06G173602v2 [Gossypium hirsutum]